MGFCRRILHGGATDGGGGEVGLHWWAECGNFAFAAFAVTGLFFPFLFSIFR